MLPFYEEERKRKINLGGLNQSATPSSILDQVRQQRQQRSEVKRRQDAAMVVQGWWRGHLRWELVKVRLRRQFEKDMVGITGIRCLMLLAKDEEALALWSERLIQMGPEHVFSLAKTGYAPNWLVLVRRLAIRLLQSVSLSPGSLTATNHLCLLSTLLSTKAATRSLGDSGEQVVREILAFLIDHAYFSLLASAIQNVPLEIKKSPNMSTIMALTTLPLLTFLSSSPQHALALSDFFSHILSVPLLPNRIPVQDLPQFLSRIPLANLHSLALRTHTIVSSTSPLGKVHLVANCTMFFVPHYAKFTDESMAWYLQFMAALFNDLPVSVFDLASQSHTKRGEETQDGWPRAVRADSDDEPEVQVQVVPSFNAPAVPVIPRLDNKTLARLAKIPSLTHIDTLLAATRKSQQAQDALVVYVLALDAVWPEHREQVLTSVLALTEGNLIRTLYKGEVRSSPLGKEERSLALFDSKNADRWAPLLFLSELYAQALVTMGDDEFFAASVHASSNAVQARNPLSIDELVAFSRQLLNIAFTLFWTEDQVGMQKGTVPGNPRYTWELVRERVTRCLVAIHARDSRKPFIPPDGWLVSSNLDMKNFVEAAVAEETRLSDPSRPTPRSLTKRTIAALSPCLGVLNNIPFAIPFEIRVSIFRHFVLDDMMKVQGAAGRERGFSVSPFGFGHHHNKTRVRVRRGRVAQDGFDRLFEADLKMPVEITFVDQFGQEEAGIDGGGVFKEFFTDLCKEVFDTDRGLWLNNTKNELYPNPHAYATEPHSLNWYRFLGRVLGKAMYEGILVDVAFASFFLARWLGKQSFFDDLSSLDPELYKGLVFLKHYNGNPEDLSLNFTIAVDELGVTKDIELVPGGSNILVTKANRLDYITLVSHYRLKKQVKKQSNAFFEGLSEMIDPRWLRMFNQQEVQILIGGVNTPIDLDDLREHTNYGGLYDDQHPVILAFWKVVNTFDQEQRRALLRFATSCSRPPLLGFKELVPNFSIRDAGTDEHRLPTSSTCVNLLKLPLYPNERIMKEKIIKSITSNSGFDLS